jgi:hypothetical protein
MDWLCSQRFHSGIISALAAFCFIRRSNILLSLLRAVTNARRSGGERGHDASAPSVVEN